MRCFLVALAASCGQVRGGKLGQLLRGREAKLLKAEELQLESLEARAAEQAAEFAQQAERLTDLERVAPKDFELLHLNVLADDFGTNKDPWFCYGAGLTPGERVELTRCYNAPRKDGKENRRLADKGWPGWAKSVLSAERIKAVEEYDARIFAWECRRERLWQTVAYHSIGNAVCERSPDIITLSECDHFDDFWRERLESHGFEAVWRKRPRKRSKDGCAIAWRASTFFLISSGGFEFGTSREAADECLINPVDRTCCFALLAWRRDPSVRLLVATTHLARRNGQGASGAAGASARARGFQYGAIFRELLAFATANGAEEVPVVLTGDLNAKDCDELAGIARALVRLLSSPTHPCALTGLDLPPSVCIYGCSA